MIGRADWLTGARARAYAAPVWALGLLLTAGMFAQIIAPALSDARHRLAPTDFSAFWAGARLAAAGRPEAAYDLPSMQAAQCAQAACDPAAPFPRPYLYPPVFLLMSLPLGILPLAWAQPVFIGAGYGLLALCLRRMAKAGWAWLPALLSPGALLNAVTGQAGCLTAACFAGGVLALTGRPAVAGACLGLLVFKPQFGLGIPIVFLAARQWRALAALAAVALGLSLLSWAVLGSAAWLAFFDRSQWAGAMLRNDAVWPKLASVYGAVRTLGGDATLAAWSQAASAAGVLAALGVLARRPAFGPGQLAALVPAALLCTPYLWDYDLVCLTVPAAWIAGQAGQSGWRRWEKPVLCVSYLWPVLSRATGIGLRLPLTPWIAAAVLGLVAVRLVAAPTRPAAV